MARWSGWWEQQWLGRQMMRNLTLEIGPEGVVTGGGDDLVGGFTFRGELRRDGTISLLKQYLGRHQVLYEGCNSGEGIFGTWYIGRYDSGRFALRPLADGAAEHDEIREAVTDGATVPC